MTLKYVNTEFRIGSYMRVKNWNVTTDEREKKPRSMKKKSIHFRSICRRICVFFFCAFFHVRFVSFYVSPSSKSENTHIQLKLRTFDFIWWRACSGDNWPADRQIGVLIVVTHSTTLKDKHDKTVTDCQIRTNFLTINTRMTLEPYEWHMWIILIRT